MLEILIEYGNILRNVGAFLDTVVFGLINNAYDLIYACASAVFFTSDEIRKIMNSIYVIVGIFALFKVALLLVNSIINPDKLFEKGSGIGNVLVNVLIMFVILVATPIVFQEAYELQRIVVEGHYVEKIFINTDTLNNSQRTPGDAMKDIIISSLIPLDENIKNDNYNCGSAGKEAIEEYLEMEVEGFEMYKIAKYASVTCKTSEGDNEGEKFYVYDYNWPITLIAAGFLTYILFSFAIDIAVRSVELAALQLLAPLFIATYVDPKSAKSGPFNKWLTTVGKTFASLFIKIGIISIMLLLFSLIDDVLDKLELPDSVSGWGKILLLIGVLIFAKKAPKWIGDMLGVEGGVGELGIGKKLGQAALIGGAITKGTNALGGAAGGLASGVHNQLKNRRIKNKDRRAQRKEIRDKNDLHLNKGSRQATYDKAGLKPDATYAQKIKALNDARRAAYKEGGVARDIKNVKQGAKEMIAAAGAGILLGGKAGIKSDGLKGSFKGGITAGNEFGQRVGMQGESIKDRIAAGQDSLIKTAEGTFGTPEARRKRVEAIEDAKKYNDFISDRTFKTGNSADNIPVSQGGFNKAFLGASGGMDAVYAAMGKMASDPTLTGGTIKTNASGQIEITGASGAKAVIDGKNLDSSMVKAGKDLFSSEGLANYEHMFAEAQKQALNSVMTNNAQMGALMQQKSSAEQSMAYNKTSAVSSVTSAGLVKDGKIILEKGVTIALSDATIDDLSEAVTYACKEGNVSGDFKNAFASIVDSFEKSRKISENTDKQIQNYQASNEKLDNMIDSLREESEENKTKTLEALLADAERKVSKKKSDVDSFSAKKEDK